MVYLGWVNCHSATYLVFSIVITTNLSHTKRVKENQANRGNMLSTKTTKQELQKYEESLKTVISSEHHDEIRFVGYGFTSGNQFDGFKERRCWLEDDEWVFLLDDGSKASVPCDVEIQPKYE